MAAATIIAAQSCDMKQSVDFIGHNGVVYTVDSAFTIVEAFAVKDGIFIETGSSETILSKYKSKNICDFNGAPVYPGFNDTHCHTYLTGIDLMSVDLRNASSFDEILERLEKAAEQNPDASCLVGNGWDQNLWEDKSFPNNKKLDELFPKMPVVLNRIDQHAVIVNRAAIEMAGLSEDDKNIDPLKALKENGKFTGVFLEDLCNTISSAVIQYTAADLRKIFTLAQNECFKYGLTSVCEPGLDPLALKVLDSMVTEGKIKLRMDVWATPTDEFKEKYPAPYKNRNMNVSAIKLFRDGALGSRGALLLKDYSDDKGNTGISMESLDQFRSQCKWAYEHGFRVATHCIGDRANREALDIYGEFLKGKNNLAWRIEHAQIVEKEDLPKFGQFSIIPSVQPTHCTSDMLWADERLGERIKNAYAYRELLGQLGWIPTGTDAPIESCNPIYTFFAAVYRKNLDFVPEGGFQMENSLTKEQALRSMTIWAAKSTLEDDVKGSIEAGKYADFVVTDKDFMNLPEKEVPSTKIEATYLGGEKVL